MARERNIWDPREGSFFWWNWELACLQKQTHAFFLQKEGKKNLTKQDPQAWMKTRWVTSFFREHVDPDSILDTASLFCAKVTPSEDTRFYHQEAPMHLLTTPMTWKSVCFTLHVSRQLWRTAEEELSVPLVTQHCTFSHVLLFAWAHQHPHCICMLRAVAQSALLALINS